MNISCPHCGTRYRIDDERVPSEGLRIKCPKCQGFFRVMRPSTRNPLLALRGSAASAPEDFESRDFLDVLLSWKVRKTDGSATSFRKLAQLEAMILRGEVLADDEISYDRRRWLRLGDISDRASFFWDMWQRADREEITSLADEHPADEGGEDAEDQPTGVFTIDSWVRDDD